MRIPSMLIAVALVAPPTTLCAQMPSRPQLSAERVKSPDGTGGTIYVKNTGNDTLIIASVTLQRCENIVESCGEHPVRKVLMAGERVPVLQTTSANRNRAWKYDFAIKTEFTQTQKDRSTTVTSIGRDGSRIVSSSIAAGSFQAAVPAITTNSACGQIDFVGLPDGHQALIMIFGTDANPVARRLLIKYDTAGTAYEYTDTRGQPSTDSLVTAIHLDLARHRSDAANIRKGAEQLFLLTGSVLDAESLGKPSEMIARVLKECGKR